MGTRDVELCNYILTQGTPSLRTCSAKHFLVNITCYLPVEVHCDMVGWRTSHRAFVVQNGSSSTILTRANPLRP